MGARLGPEYELEDLMDQDQGLCPEWCSHQGRCAEDRAAISEMERQAENAWLVAAENRWDPEAEADLRLHEALWPEGFGR